MNRNRLILLIVLAFPNAAVADSDGYYCIGPRYIAWQFGYGPPSAKPHRLFVVHFGDGRIAEPDSIELPQFQVHGMRCRGRAVDLAAFDATHTVTLDARYAPTSTAVGPRPPSGRSASRSRGTGNLLFGSRAYATLQSERHSLLVERNGHTYVLEIAAVADSVRECPPIITTRIVEIDADGVDLRQRVLHSGTGSPTCSRRSHAPAVGSGMTTQDPLDTLLDAVVPGPYGGIDVDAYPERLRSEFAQYLRRADAYRTPRAPVGGGERRMVDAAWTRYERRTFAVELVAFAAQPHRARSAGVAKSLPVSLIAIDSSMVSRPPIGCAIRSRRNWKQSELRRRKPLLFVESEPVRNDR